MRFKVEATPVYFGIVRVVVTSLLEAQHFLRTDMLLLKLCVDVQKMLQLLDKIILITIVSEWRSFRMATIRWFTALMMSSS
jgi:hypothetical protein